MAKIVIQNEDGSEEVLNTRRGLESEQASGFTPRQGPSFSGPRGKATYEAWRDPSVPLPSGGTHSLAQARFTAPAPRTLNTGRSETSDRFSDLPDTITLQHNRKRTGGFGSVVKLGALEVAQGLAAIAEVNTNGRLGRGIRHSLEKAIANTYENLRPEVQEALSREWATMGPDAAWKSASSWTYQLAKQIPILASLAVPGGIGARTAAGAAGRASLKRTGVFAAGAQEAAQQAARKAGTRGAMVGGALGEGTVIGGMVAADVVSGIENASDAELMRNPQYAAMRESGLSPEDAKFQFVQEVGYGEARQHGAIAGIGSAAISTLPAHYFGKSLTGRATEGIKGRYKGVKSTLRTAGAEAITEGPQEFFENLQTNLAAQDTYDPTRRATEGGLESFVAGSFLGAGMGGGLSVTGAMGRRALGFNKIEEEDRKNQIIGGDDVNAALNASTPPPDQGGGGGQPVPANAAVPAGKAQMDMLEGLPKKAQGRAALPQRLSGETQDMFGGPPGVSPEPTVAPESERQGDMFVEPPRAESAPEQEDMFSGDFAKLKLAERDKAVRNIDRLEQVISRVRAAGKDAATSPVAKEAQDEMALHRQVISLLEEEIGLFALSRQGPRMELTPDTTVPLSQQETEATAPDTPERKLWESRVASVQSRLRNVVQKLRDIQAAKDQTTDTEQYATLDRQQGKAADAAAKITTQLKQLADDVPATAPENDKVVTSLVKRRNALQKAVAKLKASGKATDKVVKFEKRIADISAQLERYVSEPAPKEVPQRKLDDKGRKQLEKNAKAMEAKRADAKKKIAAIEEIAEGDRTPEQQKRLRNLQTFLKALNTGAKKTKKALREDVDIQLEQSFAERGDESQTEEYEQKSRTVTDKKGRETPTEQDDMFGGTERTINTIRQRYSSAASQDTKLAAVLSAIEVGILEAAEETGAARISDMHRDLFWMRMRYRGELGVAPIRRGLRALLADAILLEDTALEFAVKRAWGILGESGAFTPLSLGPNNTPRKFATASELRKYSKQNAAAGRDTEQRVEDEAEILASEFERSRTESTEEVTGEDINVPTTDRDTAYAPEMEFAEEEAGPDPKDGPALIALEELLTDEQRAEFEQAFEQGTRERTPQQTSFDKWGLARLLPANIRAEIKALNPKELKKLLRMFFPNSALMVDPEARALLSRMYSNAVNSDNKSVRRIAAAQAKTYEEEFFKFLYTFGMLNGTIEPLVVAPSVQNLLIETAALIEQTNEFIPADAEVNPKSLLTTEQLEAMSLLELKRYIRKTLMLSIGELSGQTPSKADLVALVKEFESAQVSRDATTVDVSRLGTVPNQVFLEFLETGLGRMGFDSLRAEGIVRAYQEGGNAGLLRRLHTELNIKPKAIKAGTDSKAEAGKAYSQRLSKFYRLLERVNEELGDKILKRSEYSSLAQEKETLVLALDAIERVQERIDAPSMAARKRNLFKARIAKRAKHMLKRLRLNEDIFAGKNATPAEQAKIVMLIKELAENPDKNEHREAAPLTEAQLKRLEQNVQAAYKLSRTMGGSLSSKDGIIPAELLVDVLYNENLAREFVDLLTLRVMELKGPAEASLRKELNKLSDAQINEFMRGLGYNGPKDRKVFTDRYLATTRLYGVPIFLPRDFLTEFVAPSLLPGVHLSNVLGVLHNEQMPFIDTLIKYLYGGRKSDIAPDTFTKAQRIELIARSPVVTAIAGTAQRQARLTSKIAELTPIEDVTAADRTSALGMLQDTRVQLETSSLSRADKDYGIALLDRFIDILQADDIVARKQELKAQSETEILATQERFLENQRQLQQWWDTASETEKSSLALLFETKAEMHAFLQHRGLMDAVSLIQGANEAIDRISVEQAIEVADQLSQVAQNPNQNLSVYTAVSIPAEQLNALNALGERGTGVRYTSRSFEEAVDASPAVQAKVDRLQGNLDRLLAKEKEIAKGKKTKALLTRHKQLSSQIERARDKLDIAKKELRADKAIQYLASVSGANKYIQYMLRQVKTGMHPRQIGQVWAADGSAMAQSKETIAGISLIDFAARAIARATQLHGSRKRPLERALNSNGRERDGAPPGYLFAIQQLQTGGKDGGPLTSPSAIARWEKTRDDAKLRVDAIVNELEMLAAVAHNIVGPLGFATNKTLNPGVTINPATGAFLQITEQKGRTRLKPITEEQAVKGETKSLTTMSESRAKVLEEEARVLNRDIRAKVEAESADSSKQRPLNKEVRAVISRNRRIARLELKDRQGRPVGAVFTREELDNPRTIRDAVSEIEAALAAIDSRKQETTQAHQNLPDAKPLKYELDLREAAFTSAAQTGAMLVSNPPANLSVAAEAALETEGLTTEERSILDKVKDFTVVSVKWMQNFADGTVDLARYYKDGSIQLNKGAYDALVKQYGETEANARLAYAFLHEASHAATVTGLDTNPDLKADMERVLTQANEAGLENHYGLKDVYEFVAEFHINPSLRQDLAAIRVTEQGQVMSLLQRFMDAVKRFFGVHTGSTTMLDYVMNRSSGLYMSAANLEMFLNNNMEPELGQGYLSYELAMDPTSAFAANEMEVLPRKRLRGRFSKLLDVARESRSLAFDFGLGWITNNQLVERFGKRIPGLSRFHDLQQRMGAKANRLLNEANVMIQRMADLSSEDLSILGFLAVEARRYKIFPDQPLGNNTTNAHVASSLKSEWQFLNDEWNKLSKEGQQAWHDILAHEKEGYNKRLELVTENLMAAMEFDIGAIKEKYGAGWYERAMKTKKVQYKTKKGQTKEREENVGLNLLWVEFGSRDTELSPTEVSALLKQMNLPKQHAGPYVAAKRFGKYVVRAYAEYDFTYDVNNDKDLGALLETLKNIDPGVEITRGKKTEGEQQVDDGTLHARFSSFEREESISRAERRSTELRGAPILLLNGAPAKVNGTVLTWNGVKREGKDTLIWPEVQTADSLQFKDITKHLSTSMLTKLEKKLERNPAALAAVKEAYLAMLPETSIRKTELKYRARRGASNDIVRSFAVSSRGSAYYRAYLEYGTRISESLDEMHTGLKDADDKLKAVENEITTRIGQSAAIWTESSLGKWMDRATEFGFVSFLGSPSFWMINATQPYVVTLPYLAGRFGLRKSIAAMTKAGGIVFPPIMNKAFKSHAGLKMLSKNPKLRAKLMEEVFHALETVIDRVKDPGAKAMLRYLEEIGLIDMTLAEDLRQAASGSQIDLWNRIVDMARTMPHLIEVLNRAQTALAAYELAGGGSKGVEFAIEAVNKTQFNYSAFNKARWFSRGQSELLRPIMLFKQFAQNMYYLYASSVMDWADKSKTKAERDAAKNTLIYLTMSHTAAAGTLGGFFVEPVKWFAGLVFWLFGGTDGGDDFESWYQRKVANASRNLFSDQDTANTVSKAVTKGIPYAVLNADLNSRLGLHNLFFSPGFRSEGRQGSEWFINRTYEMGGALGALAANVFDTGTRFRKGDYYGAFKAAIPFKAVKDITSATQWANEGMLDYTGNVLRTPKNITGYDLFLKSMGVNPSSGAHLFEQRKAIKRVSTTINERRTLLMERYRRASPGERGKMMREDIREFNSSFPEFPIYTSHLVRSISEKRNREMELARGNFSYGLSPQQRRRVDPYGDF